MFIHFAATHERDGCTDGRTPGDGIYRAYAYASRGKNPADRTENFLNDLCMYTEFGQDRLQFAAVIPKRLIFGHSKSLQY